MIKRVAVAGCRHYENYDEAKEYIDFCIGEIRKKHTLIFVSGGCRGADSLGERYAAENGFDTEIYPAVWEKYLSKADKSEPDFKGRIFAFALLKYS